MLINKLNQIIATLETLINITQEDIKNIKEAKHELIFKNIAPKEEYAKRFNELKGDIDKILISRNKPVDEIFSNEEERLFDEFRKKLIEFHDLHKKFSKLSISVFNFYNTLLNKINDNESPIDYFNTKPPTSHLKLKA